jgi:hypothetical protein
MIKMGSEQIANKSSREVPNPPKDVPVSIAKPSMHILWSAKKNGMMRMDVHSNVTILQTIMDDKKIVMGAFSANNAELGPSIGFFCHNLKKSYRFCKTPGPLRLWDLALIFRMIPPKKRGNNTKYILKIK